MKDRRGGGRWHEREREGERIRVEEKREEWSGSRGWSEDKDLGEEILGAQVRGKDEGRRGENTKEEDEARLKKREAREAL